jgi:hypothetical protein
VIAAVWEGKRVFLAAGGETASIPYLLRDGRPVPFPVGEKRQIKTAESDAVAGDLLVLASTGLAEMQFAGKPVEPEKSIQYFAHAAQGHPLPAAFAQMVSDWKRAGTAPGARDVLLLAARRQ